MTTEIEDLKRIFSNGRYVGQVKSLRSTYHVFEFGDVYVIVRPDNRYKNAYNIVLFKHETIRHLQRLYEGRRGLRTRKILNDKEVRELFPMVNQKIRQLLLLQALLILACEGSASLHKRGRELVFTIPKVNED